MFIGKVVGNVWSTVKWDKMNGVKLIVVKPYHVEELRGNVKGNNQELVVVADNLGAGKGEDVVCAYGHAARVAYDELFEKNGNPITPIDAAVVAIVDDYNVEK